MRKVSMTARDELVNALARRYAVAGRAEKTRILDEFVAVAGFHRKHAMRLLRCDAAARRSEGKASRRIYGEAVCEAIVVLWEASDRICGKRLKALMPVLVEAMERHGQSAGPGITRNDANDFLYEHLDGVLAPADRIDSHDGRWEDRRAACRYVENLILFGHSACSCCAARESNGRAAGGESQ